MTLRFSRNVTHFNKITLAMTSAFSSDFPRIPESNLETPVEYSQGHFRNHPACFFLEQTTDRQICFVLSTEMPWPLHWARTFSWTSPKQNLSQIKSKIFVFLLFLDNLLVYNLKVFIFTKQELYTPFLISWKKLTEWYSKLLPTTSATFRLFSCTFMKV